MSSFDEVVPAKKNILGTVAMFVGVLICIGLVGYFFAGALSKIPHIPTGVQLLTNGQVF